MDPNMNQNNQMGVQQPQMMNQQEQVQAQVLNYNDVNYAAEEETKSTSLKKAAMYIAIIAVILIGGGVFNKLTATEEEPPASEQKAADTNTQMSTCVMEDNQTANDLVRKTTYIINYDEGLALVSYTKDYTASTIADDNQSAALFVEETTKFSEMAAQLKKTPIAGYTLEFPEPTGDGKVQTLTVKVAIDFSQIDVSKLTDEMQANSVSKVDLTKGDSKDNVESTLTSYGFSCQ